MKRAVPPASALHTRLRARQLALLVAIADRSSLRRAAADLAVTQPAATRMLAELEDALGVALFERAAWGMAPTAYGETMIRYARGMLTDLAQARDEIAALAAGGRGVVRAGAETGAVPGLLVPALRSVREGHPGIRAFLLVNSSDVLIDALARGRIDVAVGRLPADADASQFDVVRLRDETLCIVARAGHPLARRRVEARALADATWILHPPDSGMRSEASAMLAQAGVRPGRDLVETVSIVATLALLETSDALSVLPAALAEHYAAQGLIARLALDVPDGGSATASATELITRRHRALSPVAGALVAALRERADSIAPRPPAPAKARPAKR